MLKRAGSAFSMLLTAAARYHEKRPLETGVPQKDALLRRIMEEIIGDPLLEMEYLKQFLPSRIVSSNKTEAMLANEMKQLPFREVVEKAASRVSPEAQALIAAIYEGRDESFCESRLHEFFYSFNGEMSLTCMAVTPVADV